MEGSWGLGQGKAFKMADDGADEPRAQSRKVLFVRNLPFTTNDKDLEDAFSEYGPIKRCFAVRDKGAKDTCRGFGYVTFAMAEDAQNALSSLKTFKGRQIKISIADKKPRHQKRKRDDKKDTEVNDEDPLSGSDEEGADTHSKTTLKRSKADHAEGDRNEEVKEKARKSRSQRKPAQDSAGRTVVLTGLSSSITSKQIYKRCRKIGEIEKTIFPVEGKDEPTAHLLFKNYKDSREAVKKLHGKTFKGNNITASLLSREGKELSNKGQKKSKLIIRNLAFKCTEAILKETFSQFGQLVDVSIPQKIVGKRKKKLGFGFVQFANLFDAAKALEKMNMQEILGRTVAVDWALPRNQFEEIRTKKDEAKKEDDANDLSGETEGMEEDIPQSSEESEEDDHSVEGADFEQEEEHDEEEDDKDVAKQKSKRPSDVKEGKTVFIRNLSFDSTEEALHELCAQFGPVDYSKIVMNQATDHSRGTGFVKFRTPEAAEKCIAEASAQDPSEGLQLDGHKLSVVMAVSRGKAQQLEKEKAETKKEPTDKRRLYLAREGVIAADSDAAKDLSKADLLKRQKAEAEKKAKLANPNCFVSDTRLCVRNLPLKLTDQHLKKVFSTAAGGKPARIKKVLIMRSKDRLDSTGLGRPLGFGFVEFTNQSEALAALRATNNNPALFGADRRPIVEFSIENSLALKARQQRLQRSKQRQHGNEAAKQGQAPKTNKEKRQERKLRRIEKRKAKRVTRKQNEGSATDSQNNSNTSLVEGPKKSKIKDISQKRKGAEFKKKKPRVDLVEKQAFPGKRKFPFSASAPGADAQKSAKGSEAAKSNFQTKKQRKGARKKQRDGKEESNFNAMVANYKNKLFSPAVPATSGAKRTRWFE